MTEPTTTGFLRGSASLRGPTSNHSARSTIERREFPGQPYYPNDKARLAPARVGHRIAWDPTFLASCASWNHSNLLRNYSAAGEQSASTRTLKFTSSDLTSVTHCGDKAEP